MVIFKQSRKSSALVDTKLPSLAAFQCDGCDLVPWWIKDTIPTLTFTPTNINMCVEIHVTLLPLLEWMKSLGNAQSHWGFGLDFADWRAHSNAYSKAKGASPD